MKMYPLGGQKKQTQTNPIKPNSRKANNGYQKWSKNAFSSAEKPPKGLKSYITYAKSAAAKP